MPFPTWNIKQQKKGNKMTPEQFAAVGSEYAHQAALFMWAALNVGKHPQLKRMYAIKNEEKSGSAIVGGRSKAAGVKAGVSDVHLPHHASSLSGLYIEMKKPGGRPSIEQLEFGIAMIEEGYGFVVCDSWEKAVTQILRYLNHVFVQEDYKPLYAKMLSRKKSS